MVSQFELEGYTESENLWQKIMDIRNGRAGQASLKSIQNLKQSERVIRSEDFVYTPFEITSKLFITDYPSVLKATKKD